MKYLQLKFPAKKDFTVYTLRIDDLDDFQITVFVKTILKREKPKSLYAYRVEPWDIAEEQRLSQLIPELNYLSNIEVA